MTLLSLTHCQAIESNHQCDQLPISITSEAVALIVEPEEFQLDEINFDPLDFLTEKSAAKGNVGSSTNNTRELLHWLSLNLHAFGKLAANVEC